MGSSPNIRTIHNLKRGNKMKRIETKETPKMRKLRVQNQPSLHTRIVENKKKYNRKREKAQMRHLKED